MMGGQGTDGGTKGTLRRILDQEIRPHLRDAHHERRQRYLMYEAIVVGLIRSPRGTELEQLWSQIEEMSHLEPWGSGFRLLLRFQGRPAYPVGQAPGGQLRWDFSSRIESASTSDEDSTPETRAARLSILQGLLKTPAAGEPQETRQRRLKLIFLIRLYRTLCGT